MDALQARIELQHIHSTDVQSCAIGLIVSFTNNLISHYDIDKKPNIHVCTLLGCRINQLIEWTIPVQS